MCEAKPGKRCSTEACEDLAKTSVAYSQTHPGAPEVNPLPIPEAMDVTIGRSGVSWDATLSDLQVEAGDSLSFYGSEVGDDAISRLELVRDETGYRAEATVPLDIESRLPEAAGFEGDDAARTDWLNERSAAIETYLTERYGLDGLYGDDWDHQEAAFSQDVRDYHTVNQAYSRLRDRSKITDLHNETNGAFGSPNTYNDLARHLKALDDIASETDGAELRDRLKHLHARASINATPEGEKVGYRQQSKAIAKRLRELPHKTTDITSADQLREGDVVQMVRDGRTNDYVVVRTRTSEFGDPAYRTAATLGVVGGRGYTFTLNTPDLAPSAITKTIVQRIDPAPDNA